MNVRPPVDYFENLIAKAASAVQILTVVRAYLWSWPTERVAALPKSNDAWAPFDVEGRPKEVLTVLDLFRVTEALRRQCAALDESGIPLTAELVELASLFSLANQSVRRLGTALRRSSPDSHKLSIAVA